MQSFAEGSALIAVGKTQVLCAASVEDRVPPHKRGSGEGWVTAEYAMLPRATLTRNQRESVQGRLGGRTQEIQRLIGRSLRTAIDMRVLGERTITVDCDVLQADGGTRTAAITGGYVALALACRQLVESGAIAASPLKQAVAAISAGVVHGAVLLDLAYDDDVRAEVDCNVVMTADGRFAEVQATGEAGLLDRRDLDRMLDLSASGIRQLFEIQAAALTPR
ncbi:MAG: ribonuclease PH [Dehalococcoidia bacterium]